MVVLISCLFVCAGILGTSLYVLFMLGLLCCYLVFLYFCFFFKQKTAYEMRISDWSSDVCSSDLPFDHNPFSGRIFFGLRHYTATAQGSRECDCIAGSGCSGRPKPWQRGRWCWLSPCVDGAWAAL